MTTPYNTGSSPQGPTIPYVPNGGSPLTLTYFLTTENKLKLLEILADLYIESNTLELQKAEWFYTQIQILVAELRDIKQPKFPSASDFNGDSLP